MDLEADHSPAVVGQCRPPLPESAKVSRETRSLLPRLDSSWPVGMVPEAWEKDPKLLLAGGGRSKRMGTLTRRVDEGKQNLTSRRPKPAVATQSRGRRLRRQVAPASDSGSSSGDSDWEGDSDGDSDSEPEVGRSSGPPGRGGGRSEAEGPSEADGPSHGELPDGPVTVVYPALELLELSDAEKEHVQAEPDIDSAHFFVTPDKLLTISPSTWALYPIREKRSVQRMGDKAGFPCVIVTSPWVVRIPVEHRELYLRQLRIVKHVPYPPASSRFLATDQSCFMDGEDLVAALAGIPLVLIEGYGMKLRAGIAVPKYDSYREGGGVPPASRRVALDVALHHLPEYRNTLMVFGVEEYDRDGNRLPGQLPPDTPPVPSQMASPSRSTHAGIGSNVYPLFGILGRFMYGGLELHLVSLLSAGDSLSVIHLCLFVQKQPELQVRKVKVYSRIRHWLSANTGLGGKPPRVPTDSTDQRKSGVRLVAQIRRALEAGLFDDDSWPVESGGYRIEVDAWHANPPSLGVIVDAARPLLTLEGLNAALAGLNRGEGFVQVVAHHVQLAAFRDQLRHLLGVFEELPRSPSTAVVPNWKLPLCLLMCSVGVAGGSWPRTLHEQMRTSQQRAATLRKLWIACVDIKLPLGSGSEQVLEEVEEPAAPPPQRALGCGGDGSDSGEDAEADLGGVAPFQRPQPPVRPARPAPLELMEPFVDLEQKMEEAEAVVADIVSRAQWYQMKPGGKASGKVAGLLWALYDRSGQRAIAKGCYTRREAIARALSIFPDLLAVDAGSGASERYRWPRYVRIAGRDVQAAGQPAAEEELAETVAWARGQFGWKRLAAPLVAERGQSALEAACAQGYHSKQAFVHWQVTSLDFLNLFKMREVRTLAEAVHVYAMHLLVEEKDIRQEATRRKKG